MTEAKVQTEFGQKNKLPGVFELKFVNLRLNKSLPFSKIAKHQEESLFNASTGKGIYYKLPDLRVYNRELKKTVDIAKRPFDCFLLTNMNAYIVICWWKAYYRKELHYIRIEDWLDYKNSVTRKSISLKDSKQIAVIIKDLMDKNNYE